MDSAQSVLSRITRRTAYWEGRLLHRDWVLRRCPANRLTVSMLQSCWKKCCPQQAAGPPRAAAAAAETPPKPPPKPPCPSYQPAVPHNQPQWPPPPPVPPAHPPRKLGRRDLPRAVHLDRRRTDKILHDHDLTADEAESGRRAQHLGRDGNLPFQHVDDFLKLRKSAQVVVISEICVRRLTAPRRAASTDRWAVSSCAAAGTRA